MSNQIPGFDWAQQAAKFQETAMQTWRNAMQSFGQPPSLNPQQSMPYGQQPGVSLKGRVEQLL